MTRRAAASRRVAASPSAGVRFETPLAALLLVLHVALGAWVATRNSVTFDENFHVPAGVVALTRADFSSSYAQPPLARAFYGAAALAAGARLPDPRVETPGNERQLGESFMRVNADRYVRVYFAARLVAIAMSAALGWWIWREARRRSGQAAGLLALGAWCLLPEALAHGAVAGVDVPTAIVFFGTVLTGWRWMKSGSWKDWAGCAAWIAAAFLVRFSSVQLLGILPLLGVVLALRRELPSPLRALIGCGALGVVALLAVNAGYLFQGTGTPLGQVELHSNTFTALAAKLSALPSPVPVPWLRGLDYLSFLAQPGERSGYLFGQVTQTPDWRYFFVAAAVKWPLGLLALLALRALDAALRRGAGLAEDADLWLPVLVVFGTAVSSGLGYGVRYLLPAIPFLCVWGAGFAATAAGGRRGGAWRTALALLCVGAIAAESAGALPYPLSFYNAAATSRGPGDRIVNDSNADWGQGLVALRDEMKRLGIRRVHLAYHGTVDPAIYGIDYVPYTGGLPGPESDWLAVSSYLYVGLPARLLTSRGYSTQPIGYDMRPLWMKTPDARPAGCMYLYRLR